MQAVPLAALNGSMMAAFKSPSLSPPSAELAQTLGTMGNNPVYEISATTSTSPPVPQLESLEEKCRLGEDMLSYTTQFYSTVESQSVASSPSSSPKGSPGSVSSKDSSSSEGLSGLEDEGADSEVATHQSMCVPISSVEQTEHGLGATQVKHWTYEDQFKQLYNLSQDMERKEFLDKLFNFMQNKGTPITRVPIMAKQPLDLYKLFKLVVERGGLVEVIKKKAWRNVAKELNLPASITSAAFTMRSQYVKYLYPYECETVKLSEPQELQMAIDSNKRDRRHSDNMEFIAPQLQQRDLESTLSPAVTAANPTPQGLLISSPTAMALPHGSLPPYSGGFIVTGGPGGTQLVQMPPHMPAGIPIVMPSPTIPASSQPTPLALSSHTQVVSEEKEEAYSHTSADSIEPPPAKRPVPETSHIKVGGASSNRLGYSIHQTSTGNFIMTHGGMSSPGAPQLIQMGGAHGHIPIVVPTAAVREQHKCPIPPTIHMNGRTEMSASRTDNMPITALSSHTAAGAGVAVLSQRGTTATVPTAHSARNLLQMTHHHNMPGLIIPQAIGAAPPTPQNGDDKRKTEPPVPASNSTPTPATAPAKMPFANISIQPAATGGKTEEGEDQNGLDVSLLVTMEINNTVYQGVLFAKPQALSSPQR